MVGGIFLGAHWVSLISNKTSRTLDKGKDHGICPKEQDLGSGTAWLGLWSLLDL